MNITLKTLIVALVSGLFLAVIPVKDLTGNRMVINTTEEKVNEVLYQTIQTIRTTSKNCNRIVITIVSNNRTQRIIIDEIELAGFTQLNYN